MLKRVLLVEDSKSCQLIAIASLKGVANITTADNYSAAKHLLGKFDYDLLLIDINLPDGAGLDLCGEIKSDLRHSNVPIIFISSESDVTKKVVAFHLGAIDYMVKPYAPMELKARVERHLQKQENDFYEDTRMGIVLDMNCYKAYIKNETSELTDILLTPHEFKILKILLKNSNRVYSRSMIIDAVWGTNIHINDRTVDTHISALRKKLGLHGKYVCSVRGMGYKWDAQI